MKKIGVTLFYPLLALRTNMGFIEAQDPAERIRDLCFDVDKEGWKRWSVIVDDMNSLYIRLVVKGTATLDEVLDELYAKYPFLQLEGVIGASSCVPATEFETAEAKSER